MVLHIENKFIKNKKYSEPPAGVMTIYGCKGNPKEMAPVPEGN